MTTDNGQIDWGHWLLRLVAIIIEDIIIGIPIWLIYNFGIVPLISVPYMNFYGIIYYASPWWASLVFLLLAAVILMLYATVLDVI